LQDLLQIEIEYITVVISPSLKNINQELYSQFSNVDGLMLQLTWNVIKGTMELIDSIGSRCSDPFKTGYNQLQLY